MQDYKKCDIRNEDLRHCVFTGEDIRGMNFAGKDLEGANFSKSKSGLHLHSVVGLLTALFPPLIVSGILSMFISSSIISAQSKDLSEIARVSTSFAILLALLLAFSYKEILVAVVAFITAISLVCSGAVLLQMTGERFTDYAFFSVYEGIYIGVFQGAVGFIGLLLIAVIFACAEAISEWKGLCSAVLIALAFSCKGIVPGLEVEVGAMMGLFITWSVYICVESFRKGERYVWIRDIAISFSSIGGTSFYGAILIDADFSDSDLRSADLRNATLTRTCWKDARQLNKARLNHTYLSNPKVRSLLCTGNAQKRSFTDVQDLRGLNLRHADLAEVDFTGCNLKGSTLQQANLKGARLIESNLNGANLYGANLLGAELAQAQLDKAILDSAVLTGAYIGFWNITTSTQLKNVICDYVFLNLSKVDAEFTESRKRKPDALDVDFAEGEFSAFIKPLTNTLDFFYKENFSFTAFALAVISIREHYPEAKIELLSVEKKGEYKNTIIIRASVSSTANTSEISSLHKTEYEEKVGLPSEDLLALVEDRFQQIQDLLREMVSLNSLNSNVVQHNYFGATMPDNSSSFQFNNSSGIAVSTGDGGIANGETTHNYAEKHMSLTDAVKEIQTLLRQLESSYPNATEVEKIAYANDRLPPTRRDRLVCAVQNATDAALDEIPYGRIIKATVDGWNNPQQ